MHMGPPYISTGGLKNECITEVLIGENFNILIHGFSVMEISCTTNFEFIRPFQNRAKLM